MPPLPDNAHHDGTFLNCGVGHLYFALRVLGEVRMSVERVALCRGWGEPHPRQQKSGPHAGGNLLP